jgi:hypothetical protein
MTILALLVPGVPMMCYGLAVVADWHGLARRLATRGVIPLLLPLRSTRVGKGWMWRDIGQPRLARLYRIAGVFYVALGQLLLLAVGIDIGGVSGRLLMVMAPLVVGAWCVIGGVGTLIDFRGKARRAAERAQRLKGIPTVLVGLALLGFSLAITGIVPWGLLVAAVGGRS